jgi:glycosyltransferase involved in cell wall biosynthesis
MRKSWNPLQAWMQQKSQRVRESSVPKSTPSSTRLRTIGRVSVILSVYNQQADIRRTFDAISKYSVTHPNFSFIFVNDGSVDHTKHILAAGIRTIKSPQIHLISYSPRAGKGYAIRQGVDYADSDVICYLDSDLAYSLDHLDLMVEKLRDYDIVVGSRRLIANPKAAKLNRGMAENMIDFLSCKILNLRLKDTQIGLKGFRREVAKDLFSRQKLTEFSFDLELIYLAKKRGYSIGEIPANASQKRQKKTSKVNLLQDSIKMLLDLLKIRFNDQLGRYQ